MRYFGVQIELFHAFKSYLLLVIGQLRQGSASFLSNFELGKGQLVIWLEILYCQQVLTLFAFNGLALEETMHY